MIFNTFFSNVKSCIQCRQDCVRITEFRQRGSFQKFVFISLPISRVNQIIIQRTIFAGKREVEIAGFNGTNDVKKEKNLVERRTKMPIFF